MLLHFSVLRRSSLHWMKSSKKAMLQPVIYRRLVLRLCPHQQPRSSRWNTEDMLRLLHVAYHSQSRAEKGESLAFVGPTDQIEETLMAAMTLLPDPLLPRCSFDTVFQNGGNIRHTYYWATGLDRAPRQQTITTIDVTASSLAQSLPIGQQSTYERWAAETVSDGGIERVVTFKEQAYPLCQYIEGNGPAPHTTPDWITERLVNNRGRHYTTKAEGEYG